MRTDLRQITMTPTLERVHEFLMSLEITAHPGGDGEVLVVPMDLTHCRCNLVFQHEAGSDEMTILALHPSNVPADRRHAVAEFLARLNWNLGGQRFLLDWADGEVRLRRDVSLLGPLKDEKLSYWLRSACVLLDGFHPALMSVVYRGTPPLQALEQGEAEYQVLIKNLKADGQEEK